MVPTQLKEAKEKCARTTASDAKKAAACADLEEKEKDLRKKVYFCTLARTHTRTHITRAPKKILSAPSGCAFCLTRKDTAAVAHIEGQENDF